MHRAAARLDLLQIAHHLVEDRPARQQEHRRRVRIDQGDRAVLHLGGRIALGVDVADLLQLQRPLQRHRVVILPAQVQEVGDVAVPLGDAAHVVVAGQRAAHRVGDRTQFSDHLRPLQAGQMAHAAEVEGEHGQDGDLIGERLGAGHADLRTGMQIDAAVGLAGNAAADDVAQSQSRMALALRLAQRRQGVGRLARLRDGDDDGVAIDGRIAIAELAGVLDLDRDAGELLEQILADQGRVIAGAARGQDDALGAAELLRVEVQAAEVSGGVGVVEPAAQGVLQRFGLLVDLLEHVVIEDALVGVARRPSRSCGRRPRRACGRDRECASRAAVSTHS